MILRRQWYPAPFKSSQMLRRSKNTTNLEATQTTDLVLAQRLQHHLLAGSPDRQAEAEDPCLMTKSLLKSYSTDSLEAAVWVEDRSVGTIMHYAENIGLTCYQGGFDTGPQFVFNLGGGPGFRVHQFGGGRPRRRPREANGNGEAPQTASSALSNLLPLLVLFVLPLLSSIFSSSTPKGPSIRFDTPEPPYIMQRTTPRLKVEYFLNPVEVEDYSNRNFKDLDRKAENSYVTNLQYDCQLEMRTRNRMIENAQGWFFQDVEKMRDALNYEMRSCRRLDDWGFSRSSY